jgi:hypothetical protein
MEHAGTLSGQTQSRVAARTRAVPAGLVTMSKIQAI